MEGISLRINVVETGNGDWVLLCQSPFGRSSTRVPEPFDQAELVRALHDLESANLRSAAKLISRKATSPELTAQEFGGRLVETLFSGEANVIFDRCRAKARELNVPMRVLLETTGPHASQIPWEFATDPATRDDYLALRVPIARSLSVAEPVPPLSVTTPLKVLGIQARPRDLPELDYREEQRRIADAFDQVSSEHVQVTWLDGDRWRDIDTALKTGEWHILHFVGHGGFSDEIGAGYLELSDDEGNAQRISSVDIGRAISRSRGLRLVVLNACDSAASGGSDVFASTAAKLMREGIPAVVAMQYEITDDAALAFSAAFYEAIAHNVHVDQAVTFARETVRINLHSLEWATPVLFLASEETALFDVHIDEPRPVAKPSGATAPPAGPVPGPVVAQRAPLVPDAPPAVRAAVVQSPQPVPGQAPREWSTGLKDRLETTFRSLVSTGGEASGVPRTAPRPVSPAAPHAGPTSPSPAPSRAPSQPAATRQPSPPRPQGGPAPAGGQPGVSSAAGSAQPEARTALAVAPDGRVVLATAGGGIRVWSLATHAWTARCSLPAGITAHLLVWHPSGRYVASANDDGTVAVWDVDREARVRLIDPSAGPVRSLAFSHDGRWLAVACGDRTVRVHDTRGAEVRRVHVADPSSGPGRWARGARPLGPLAFGPDDRSLVVASNDGRVSLVDVRGQVGSWWPHDVDVAALVVVAGDRLATCSDDARLRVWDWAGRVLWRQDVAPARHLAADADGRLAVGSRDGSITLWSTTGSRVAATALQSSPTGIGFFGSAVVTGEATGQLRVWQV